MLSVLLFANDMKAVVPTLMLAAPSVPYYGASLCWCVVSRVLPEPWFRYVDDKMWSLYQRLVLFFFENVSGVKVVLYGDTEKVFSKKENALYISNHQCSVDWVVADMLAVRQGSMGHLRYMLKDTLQYVPLYGWSFYQHGCVYVRRGRSFRHDITETSLNYLKNTWRPGWIVIFPEGTRFSQKKLKIQQRSNEYCQENGIHPPFRNVFAPRSKGFLLALNALRSRLDAVYDVTIAYSDSSALSAGRKEAPDMFSFVCCRPNSEVHIHVKRIPIDSLPQENENVETWLASRFVEKERLLSDFFKSEHKFPQEKESDSVISLLHTFPVFLFWCSVLFPTVVTSSGRRLFALTWISGSLGSILWMKLKKAA